MGYCPGMTSLPSQRWTDRARFRAGDGPPRERWATCLRATVTAPLRARTALEPLRPHLSSERMEEARLMVSELVTNAVIHAVATRADGRIELEVAVLAEEVVVSVADGGAGFEPGRLQPPQEGIPGRRGLPLVAALADSVGIDSRSPFRIWFRVSLDGPRVR